MPPYIIAHIFTIVKELKERKMKICAIICEYNPFHNGHQYQLNIAREHTNADALICIMSGNFVQRGENAILDKYTRAKHAVLAGADAVIELPTPFATSNAELFAKGAIHVLSSIPEVEYLCFGAERADKLAFIQAARYLNDEPKEVSEIIKNEIAGGSSYAKARANAFAGFIPLDLLCSSNNILGLEYTRAILEKQSSIQIVPIQRTGANYNDEELKENFSSASAIRGALQTGETVGSNVPEFVGKDLENATNVSLDKLEKYAVISQGRQELAKICDCTEGLENAFYKAATQEGDFVSALTSPRYTASRIRRIALQNLLKIPESLIRESLQTPLYLRVLAAKKERNDVLSALARSTFPIIARSHDEDVLQGTAKACFTSDVFAEQIYKILNPIYNSDKNVFI